VWRESGVGIFRRREQSPKTLEPSDLLIALCGLSGEEHQRLASLILDYQGGGITTKPDSVAILRRVPDVAMQSKMKETGQATFETFEQLGFSNMAEGMAHGIFVTALWESLGMTGKEVLDIHRAISGGTISAISQLLQRERLEDAIYVALLGQCLYMNASDWHDSRR
jgi:hypothetical protein